MTRHAVLLVVLGSVLGLGLGAGPVGPARAEDPRLEGAVALNPCRPGAAANPCAPGATPRNPCGENPCAAKNPCSAGNPCGAGAANPCGGAPGQGRDIEGLLAEFLTTSREIAGRPGGEERVVFPGTAERPSWFEALAVTHSQNPLLEEDCKKEALQLSVDSLRVAHGLGDEEQALRAAGEHLQQHVDFVRSHGISYAGYLQEVAECRSFCGPLVASLMKCQVLSVARNVHGIVLFELDSDEVDPRYASGVLANLAGHLAAGEANRLALIGRASRIGDLLYNRRLAARRALAVRDSLIDLGVPRERIRTMWFGWEPPQISAWVAAEYGMEDLHRREGTQRMNQSVVVVAYRAEERT